VFSLGSMYLYNGPGRMTFLRAALD
jgi:hypothetical protein